MRAMVTGGAGFIGSNLVDALVADGAEVTVLDDLSTGRRANLAGALAAGARLCEASVADPAAVREAFGVARPEVVFHLAAQIDVRRSVADPAFDALVNVEGTLAVLEAARLAGSRRVVYVSTGGAIYGEAPIFPTPEDAPVAPLAPYGQSKFAAEGYCSLYARLHGLSTVTLRLANVYGPRQDPLGEGGVVAIFCGRLLTGERATIYGDGRQTRDYVYVGDVVDAALLAAGAAGTEPLNVGSGTETTVVELAAAMRGLGAGGFETAHAPERPGEVRRSCLDPDRAAGVIGWRPRTSLADGLRGTLAWQRDEVSQAAAAEPTA